MRAARCSLALLCALPLAAQAPLPLWSRDGDAAGDQCGAAVAALGDVDGDGCADVAVGEPFHDGGGADAGRVRAFSGRTGALLWSLVGSAGDRLGSGTASGSGAGALAAIGDLDGDGAPDLAVGAGGADAGGVDSGVLRLVSGRTGALLRSHPGLAAGEQFGLCAAGVGDLDGDGVPDYAGGAPLADGPGLDRGLVRIFSGRTGALLWQQSGLAEGDHFGHAIAGLGDVDGDGRDDFATAAPWSDQVASKCGSATVWSGATRQPLYTLFGAGLGYEFGSCLAALGDVDGDGRADLAIGTPEEKTNGDDAGAVFVHRGADGLRLLALYGNSAYDYFGHQIAAGDLDGDGRCELLVGAPFDEQSGVPTNAGLLRAYALPGGGLRWTVGGNQTGEQLGRAVATGDLNGDGFADAVVGAPLRDSAAGADVGALRGFAGAAAQPATAVSGVGCPAARPLRLAYGAPARLGQPLLIQLQNGPAALAPGYLVFGFRAGAPYPLSLLPLGLPGCTQYTSADWIAPILLQNGAASLSLTVPAGLAPSGLAFWNQGAVIDVGAPGGLAVSDLGRAVIAP